MWVLLLVFFSCFQMGFYFVTTGWIFEIGLCENSIKSIGKRKKNETFERLDYPFVLATATTGGCDSAAGALGISRQPKCRQSIYCCTFVPYPLTRY